MKNRLYINGELVTQSDDAGAALQAYAIALQKIVVFAENTLTKNVIRVEFDDDKAFVQMTYEHGELNEQEGNKTATR